MRTKEEALKTCRDIIQSINRLAQLEPRANNDCGAGYSLTFKAIRALAKIGIDTADEVDEL